MEEGGKEGCLCVFLEMCGYTGAQGKFGGASRWFGEVGWWVLFHYRRESAGVIGACWALSGGAYLAGQERREMEEYVTQQKRCTYRRRAERVNWRTSKTFY